jgi:tetratricopeptide (TPR) repeat protein
VCHAELGTFTEGHILGEEGLQIAEAGAHLASLMVAFWGAGVLTLRQGDLLRALPRLERAVSLCQDVELPIFFPQIAAALGEAYTLDGRSDAAVPLLTQAMEQATVRALGPYQALCHLSLGEAQMLAGRLEDAHALAERALALTRAHQERGYQAYTLRLLGDIAARREPLESVPAEASYRQALALAEELGMRPLQAHCHLGLGTLYAQGGQVDRAYVALSTAMALYQAMDMTFWQPQAEAALIKMERQRWTAASATEPRAYRSGGDAATLPPLGDAQTTVRQQLPARLSETGQWPLAVALTGSHFARRVAGWSEGLSAWCNPSRPPHHWGSLPRPSDNSSFPGNS